MNSKTCNLWKRSIAWTLSTLGCRNQRLREAEYLTPSLTHRQAKGSTVIPITLPSVYPLEVVE